MIVKYIYICEKCNKEFLSETEAIDCEKAHYTIVDTKPTYPLGVVLPQSIAVTFNNGGKRNYELR